MNERKRQLMNYPQLPFLYCGLHRHDQDLTKEAINI